eukprot:CAMPEP_0113303190 /NCGR_PEP_ID=MMETSP0010_2-20120614/3712_1 /TAXON_ID=216773 ORGANISM="Corethron hystrix, Strain 308" /NCGR_SAMPLE_ID=MMETSP0010_2 /ASSEMBLY_ACC=CAM_ASM_000155 /LENGTH=63 /DNA_ID=CAMNT_0000157151 /DNA_START=373 /DNA_END=564 /DNA_ORIENTATION=+ /assembly_acc=CAM_ASM_000155
MGEEFVCNKSIKDGGKRVTEYELGADTPIEPASVGRVAEVFVDPMCDKLMFIWTLNLHDMMKI